MIKLSIIFVLFGYFIKSGYDLTYNPSIPKGLRNSIDNSTITLHSKSNLDHMLLKCNETDCYYDLNELNEIQVIIKNFKVACNLTDSQFKNHIQNIFEKEKKNNFVMKYVCHYSDNDYQYLVRGCFNYDRVKYIKEFHKKQIVEVIKNKHILYQYVFYFSYGFVVWSYQFSELVIKFSAGLLIYFSDTIEYLTSFI